ncbi:hypothetical protein [Nostoc sp. DSM 114167]|jgi:uncharacterized protein (DUF4213/DUF364 family)|uniref:hypothetical protein n=1 Tax=Nostoc sp. DSM 114167 TaxID=3439050 RepID=UPI00404537BA
MNFSSKITPEENTSIARDCEEILKRIKNIEFNLNLPEIQQKFENEKDESRKQDFLEERKNIAILRSQLETAALKEIAANLKKLEPDLFKGIEDLTQAIERVENTVNILTTLQNVTGIIRRVLSL